MLTGNDIHCSKQLSCEGSSDIMINVVYDCPAKVLFLYTNECMFLLYCSVVELYDDSVLYQDLPEFVPPINFISKLDRPANYWFV